MKGRALCHVRRCQKLQPNDIKVKTTSPSNHKHTCTSHPTSSNALSEQWIHENYDLFIGYLKEKFTGERLEKLLKLYAEDNYGLRASVAPASTFKHFHNAHVGGYLQHVMNVDKASAGAAKLFEAMGGEIDFTEEERCMAALSHDLGKLGPKEGEYYLPQTEEWAIKKRGQMFMMNPKIQMWDVTDLALFILQEYAPSEGDVTTKLSTACPSERVLLRQTPTMAVSVPTQRTSSTGADRVSVREPVWHQNQADTTRHRGRTKTHQIDRTVEVTRPAPLAGRETT